MTELVYLPARTGQLRTAAGGLIVPVVALVGDLVLHALNSTNPELVPLSTLAANPQAWNGVPATLNHPMKDGKPAFATEADALGRVTNARLDGRRLCADLDLDVQKAERMGAGSLLQRLRNGEQVDVSVGAHVTTAAEHGTHNGKRYAAVWKTIAPDHIAVLEHQRGACSCHDGCGTHQRAAAGADFTPPNPYAAALERLRASDAAAAAARTQQPTPLRATVFPKGFAPPDPYRAQLEQMRKESR